MVSENLHTQLLASHQLENLIKNYKPMHLDTIPVISQRSITYKSYVLTKDDLHMIRWAATIPYFHVTNGSRLITYFAFGRRLLTHHTSGISLTHHV